jgi:hypothetical protein
MDDANWLFVERCGGRMRRITVLDEHLNVITTHDRYIAPADTPSDECQLLRAVELEQMAHTA